MFYAVRRVLPSHLYFHTQSNTEPLETSLFSKASCMYDGMYTCHLILDILNQPTQTHTHTHTHRHTHKNTHLVLAKGLCGLPEGF